MRTKRAVTNKYQKTSRLSPDSNMGLFFFGLRQGIQFDPRSETDEDLNTRQQRRAESREAAKLLLEGKKVPFRWEYASVFIALAVAIFLVLAPPETMLIVTLLLVFMLALLIYIALHLVRSIFHARWKWAQTPVAVILAVGLVGLFSLWILRPAKIELEGVSRVPTYGEGSVVSGIKWRKEYAELDLTVRNASEDDYSNLDIEITTDLMFEDLRQQSGLASCTIVRNGKPFGVNSQRIQGVKPTVDENGTLRAEGGTPAGPVHTTGDNYKVIAVDKNGQIVSLSGKTNRTYRVRCDKVPASSQNNFVAALSVVNPIVNGKLPTAIYDSPKPLTQLSAKIKLTTGILERSLLIENCKIGLTCKG